MSLDSILVVGSLNMDQIVRLPRLPAWGETLLSAGSPMFVPGGKGANQAVALARLGASVSMAGRVGNDPFGQQLVDALRVAGIDTGLMAIDEQETTGTAFIFLAPDSNNAIVVASGANMRVGADQSQFAAISDALPRAQALVLQLEIPVETVRTLVAAGHSAHVPVILNAAPAQPLSGETLRMLTTLIVNETEALALRAALAGTGLAQADSSSHRIASRDDALQVALALQESGIPMVVITLGAQGAIMVTTDAQGTPRSFYQPAPQVKVVDTTAAGDCFVAALTVALIEGQAPAQALRFAIDASALKVTRFGAQPGLPTRAEVATFQSSPR